MFSPRATKVQAVEPSSSEEPEDAQQRGEKRRVSADAQQGPLSPAGAAPGATSLLKRRRNGPVQVAEGFITSSPNPNARAQRTARLPPRQHTHKQQDYEKGHLNQRQLQRAKLSRGRSGGSAAGQAVVTSDTANTGNTSAARRSDDARAQARQNLDEARRKMGAAVEESLLVSPRRSAPTRSVLQRSDTASSSSSEGSVSVGAESPDHQKKTVARSTRGHPKRQLSRAKTQPHAGGGWQDTLFSPVFKLFQPDELDPAADGQTVKRARHSLTFEDVREITVKHYATDPAGRELLRASTGVDQAAAEEAAPRRKASTSRRSAGIISRTRSAPAFSSVLASREQPTEVDTDSSSRETEVEDSKDDDDDSPVASSSHRDIALESQPSTQELVVTPEERHASQSQEHHAAPAAEAETERQLENGELASHPDPTAEIEEAVPEQVDLYARFEDLEEEIDPETGEGLGEHQWQVQQTMGSADAEEESALVPYLDDVAFDEADSFEEGEDEEDFEQEEFDPYLFIASLPPGGLPPETWPAHLGDGRFALPPKRKEHIDRHTLVLDLDETLVHCSMEEIPDADMQFPVDFGGITYKVYARIRPGFHEFLESVAQHFEVVVFTASQQAYADTLLALLDPEEKWIHHRMFRESCVFFEGNYLKDLNTLGRDLQRTMIVDNSPQTYGLQIENGVPIESWYDDPLDQELIVLLPFLLSLTQVDDIRPHIRDRFKTHERVEWWRRQLLGQIAQ